jgi:hypothetical protein
MSQYYTMQNQGHAVFPKSPLPGQEESEERCIAERYLDILQEWSIISCLDIFS